MTAWVISAVSGVEVVLAGIWPTHIDEVIAEETGMGGAWVGALFRIATDRIGVNLLVRAVTLPRDRLSASGT
jgi:hypothetical protein